MAEDLQHLIERIHQDGVEKAQSEADEILSRARAEADKIVSGAEVKAKSLIEKAEKDSQVYTQRSEQALAQAGRDLLLTVGQGIENIMNSLLKKAAAEALTPEVLGGMIAQLAESGAEFKLNESDREKVLQVMSAKFAGALKSGIDLGTDSEVLAGFKVSSKGDSAYRDFTDEAIVEALSNFLRPQLAEIVKQAATS